MGEYTKWLRQHEVPISELTAAVWPEPTRKGTKEHKAFLEDVKRSAVGPNRRAMAEWF